MVDRSRTRFRIALALLGVFGLAATASAAPPTLTAVTPRGWKVGDNEIAVQGTGFTPETKLAIDLPGAEVKIAETPAPTTTQIKYLVKLPPQTAAGVVEVRLASEQGLTDPALVIVDALANVAEVEPNSTLAQAQAITLPTAVEGRLSGAEADWFAFDGKKDERLVVEMAARRLDSASKPVLRLLDSRHLEMQIAYGVRSLGGDARIVATLPADGRYYVELHDLAYRGDNKQYRLLIGPLQVASGLFPLGGKRGSTVPVRFFGGTLASEVEQTVKLDSAGAATVQGASLPAASLASPLPLPMAISDLNETLEAAGADGKPQPLAMGSIVNGRLAEQGERDRYLLSVSPGSKLHLFVESERLGAPLDAVLEIASEKEAVLMTQDDGPGTADPELLYTVPEGMTTLIVSIADVNRRGGPPFVYRLGVEPASGGLPFELSLLSPLVNVPAGGNASVRVKALRRDFTGPIKLRLAGDVPPGVKLSGETIEPGATDTLLSLSVPVGAPLQAGKLEVVGDGTVEGKPPIVRTARLAKQPMYEAFPWLQSHFAGAVTQPGPITLEVQPVDAKFLRGVEYSAKVSVKRAADQTGPINLRVQTSQTQVQGTVVLPAFALVTIPAGANEGVVKLKVPPNSSEMPVTYTVTGQLMNPKDTRIALGTYETAAVSTQVAMPFAVELGPNLELKRGARNLVAAKLKREGSFNEPVNITFSGLPAPIRLLPVTVPAGVSDFNLPVGLASTFAPGPIANVKLTATWASTPPLAARPIDLPLVVAKDDPPNYLEIFDDGEDFVGLLTEGPGMVSLDASDKHSGKESVAVKGEFKARATIPALGAVITKEPQAGQYRFIRFAWKKKGGAGIMLSLAKNGQLAPASEKGTDYRYVAGSDKYNSKAVKLADTPPSEWTVVTRDLFDDHGPFVLTGLSLVAMDGEAALFDHIYLARSEEDFPK